MDRLTYNPHARCLQVQSQAPFRDARPRHTETYYRAMEMGAEVGRLRRLSHEAPNRLFGAYTNEDGDAV